MSGGSQTTTSKGVNQQMLDPNAYGLLYGTGAVQPQYNKKGAIKNQAEVDASIAASGGQVGGLLGSAQDLYGQGPLDWYPGGGAYDASAGTMPGSTVAGNTTYVPYNSMQTGAIGQAANYLGTPGSMAGYDALNTAGNWLMNPGNAPGPIDFGAVMKSIGDTMGAGSTPTAPNQPAFAWNGAPQISDISAKAVPQAAGGNAGSVGVDYSGALKQALSGGVDNPYLQQMTDEQTRLSNRNFTENVLPTLSTGAQAAGQYGGSANAKIYANAGRDLQSDLHGRNIGLFGTAFESAQNRMADTASTLSGHDTERAVAAANAATQASIANQRTALDREIANREFALRSGELGLSGATAKGNYDLGYGNLGLGYSSLGTNSDIARYGLGLDAAKAQGDYGLNQYGSLGNAMTGGAGMVADAAGIPLNNMQSLFGLGSLLRDDTQGQYGGAIDRWNYEQQAPWALANNMAGLVYPGAGLGAANTSSQTQTTSSQLGPGQIIGGAAALGMGMFGGGGMFGSTGAFGQGGRWGPPT